MPDLIPGVILSVLNEFDAGTFEGTFMLSDHVAFDDHLGNDFETAETSQGRRIVNRVGGSEESHN